MIHSSNITFKQDFSLVEDYSFGKAVTRENFISFLIMSYELSRGLPELQKIYFIWSEKMAHFDYRRNLDTFVGNGAFTALEPIEQDLFRDAFLRTEKHKHIFETPERLEKEMWNSLIGLRKMCDMHTDFSALSNRAMDFFNLRQMTSFDDFRKAAAKYIEAKNSE